MQILEFTIRLSAALLLGAAVGVERQLRQRSAGLRTNTLVSLGAAAFTLISYALTSLDDGVYKGDTTRIIGQIVSGIGFLGAGVIMKDGLSVQGLNTAATIWCSAAVGALCGVGLYAEATVVTVGIVATHLLLRPLGIKLGRWNFAKSMDNQQTDYLLVLKCHTDVENHIRVLLMQMLGNEDKIMLQSLTSDDTDKVENVIIKAVIKAATREDGTIERVASRLTIEEKLIKVSWEIIETQSEL